MSDQTQFKKPRIHGYTVPGWLASRSGYEAYGRTKEQAKARLDFRIIYGEVNKRIEKEVPIDA